MVGYTQQPSRVFDGLLILSLTMGGLILGFFYAWICSTMWGLDATDPRIAIGAMQAMNASVRNLAFGPVFFGTPFVLFITALVGWQQGVRKTSILLGAAGVVFLFGYLVLTATINVPMNEALGRQLVPQDLDAAQEMWNEYSHTWQFWNTTRFFATGAGFLFTAYAAILAWPDERLALRQQVQ